MDLVDINGLTAKLKLQKLLKALANEDTLLRTHCCGHIVADTNVSPFARERNICCGHKLCVRDTKIVSDFVQKHFVSARNVLRSPRNIMGNNVSATMCRRLPGPEG